MEKNVKPFLRMLTFSVTLFEAGAAALFPRSFLSYLLRTVFIYSLCLQNRLADEVDLNFVLNLRGRRGVHRP